MKIPTEPIGSIPRPTRLIAAIEKAGDSADPSLDPLYDEAIRDTIEQFEATGSPIITDGEQRKYHNFWTYCVHGLPNTAPDGFKIPFSAGHVRRMPRLTAGPFRYRVYADRYLDAAKYHAHVSLKQAVISPSALSLMPSCLSRCRIPPKVYSNRSEADFVMPSGIITTYLVLTKSMTPSQAHSCSFRLKPGSA
jgi:5-methyltetrahydropteroyltriglutamate--homocysteine methyltransferase